MDETTRIIIDTDPGIDDILALLLALSSSEKELEILLISVTFGNVEVLNCLRNVVFLFHVIEKEMQWRRSSSRPEGFATLKSSRPLVAVGADKPLAEQLMMADHFHGIDGLGGIHTSHAHLHPAADTWHTLFTKTTTTTSTVSAPSPTEQAAARELQHADTLFTPTSAPAHEEILRLLRENAPNTITLVALGPLTTLARAAAVDPDAFHRVKEVVVMGGAIALPGNITPVAEFNTHSDPHAAARVLSLTSPSPASTLPPTPIVADSDVTLQRVQEKPLNLTLLPLDVTEFHRLRRRAAEARIKRQASAGSPLAEWVGAFLESTFKKLAGRQGSISDDVAGSGKGGGVDGEEGPGKAAGGNANGSDGADVGLSLHDPLCVWYVLTRGHEWKSVVEDIRVETGGQWTRGMCVVDMRERRKRLENVKEGEKKTTGGDHGGWLDSGKGNRVKRMVESGWEDSFAGKMLDRIFGEDDS